MKAFTFYRYGNPESVLKLNEVPKPTHSENEILLKVKAAAINDYDWSLVRGKPFLYRLMFGLVKPKKPIPGMELSGVIEAVGSKVTTFKPGDQVYGDISDDRFGAFAEYITLNESSLIRKPDNISFEEAASVSHASMLAWQGLIEIGKLQKNQSILINGAGGGVGTFAIQIAQQYQTRITAVDSQEKFEQMQSLGAHQFIDYKSQDFTNYSSNPNQYDLILDAKTNRSVFSYLKKLRPNGRYVTVGGSLPRLFLLLIFKWLIKKFTSKSVHIVSLKTNKDLKHINELFEQKKIRTVIDGPHPFENLPQLIRYFGDGKHKGKVVVTI